MKNLSKNSKFPFNILYSAFFILFLVPILYSSFLILDSNKPDSLTREFVNSLMNNNSLTRESVNPLIINTASALEPTQSQLDQTASILSSIQSIINKLKIEIQSLFGNEAKAATETIGLVRQDCTGYSNCFTSLSAWEAAYGGISFGACAAGDLVCADKIAIAQIDGAWTSADTTAVIIDGWTTDATHYIRIYTTAAARHDGKWNTGKYRLEAAPPGIYSGVILVREGYTRIEGVQVNAANYTNNYTAGIFLDGPGGHLISYNIIKTTAPQTGGDGFSGIRRSNYFVSGTVATKIWNNIIYDFSYGNWGWKGIYQGGSTTGLIYAYNNTIQNTYASYTSAGNFICINCISQDSVDGFAGTFDASSDYNLSDRANDAPGTNSKNSTTATFVDKNNDDFHLSSFDTSAKDNGANLSADTNLAFTTDIDNDTRSAPWDIGADEYTGAAPPPPSDTTLPVLSSGSPTGALSSGTTQTTLSLATNENATCKYGTVANTAYASIVNTFTPIGGTSHSQTITGLTNGTSYNYYVRCQDTAGNANTTDYTISFSVANPSPSDTTSPSIPTNLTASSISSSQINLSWTASGDDVGVIGYKIYRCAGLVCAPTTQIATSATNSYSNTGLTASTAYTYAVSAYDAAGNESGKSITASATTQATSAFPVANMPVNSWLSVANTHLRDVAPASSNLGNVAGIMAYSGAALDTLRSRLVVWGGGHNDYYGNELYAFDVNTLKWSRLTNPNPNPSLDNCINSDGSPGSRHTYNSLAYIAHADRFFGLGGSEQGPAGNAGCGETWTFDFTASKWTDQNPSGSLPGAGYENNASYDPATKRVWWGDDRVVTWRGNGQGLYSYDYDINQWTKHNSDYLGYYVSTVDTKRGLIVFVSDGYNGSQVFAYDIKNGNYTKQIWDTTGGAGFVGSNKPGLAYDPVSDRIVGWSGGAVYVLNPDTKVWTTYNPPGAPTAALGTYGRWRYVPSVNAFILVTSVDENVYFYKLTAGGGSPPPSSDTTPPIVSLTAPTSGSTVSGFSVTISATASDNIGVTGVQFKLDGANLQAEDTTIPYSISWNTTTATNGSHTITAVARDAAGNQTTSAAVTITVSNAADTQAPSIPINLIATAVSSSQINLSWNASTDNIGVTGYYVYRGGTQIATVAATSYQHTGLSPSMTYMYTVAAVDGAGNVSLQSSPVSATTPSAPPPTAGLVAAYSFNEGSGTTVTDASGNANNGTLTNSPIWTTQGRYGNALTFDGINDYVSAPNSPSIDISGTNLTVSLWTNIVDTTIHDYVILGKPWTSNAMISPWYQYGIEFGKTAKTANFSFGDPLGRLRGPFSMPVPIGVWAHIAFTYDGASVKGYVDGVQKFSTPESASIQARGNSLRIGVDGAFGQPFEGMIDELRVYNRALTQPEIQNDMSSGIEGRTPLPPPAFNFSLSNGGNKTVTQGSSVSTTITSTLTSGTSQSVSFSASGIPQGATYTYASTSCNPTCTTSLTIATTASTPQGSYAITVTATGGSITKTTTFNLIVTRSTKFMIGDRVQTTANLNVRAIPSTSGALLGTQPIGAVGTITGGPNFADGFWWWQVNYDADPDGWSVENFLEKAPGMPGIGLKGDCSSEGGLAGRTDVVFCEPWENPSWWQNEYVSGGSKTNPQPVTAVRVDHTSLVSTNCISGNCLKVDMLKGESGSLAIHWPLAAAGLQPEQLYFRYYIKLSPNFTPILVDPSGNVVGWDGKFPGLADVRTSADSSGQCGNGGNPSDGINCWSMRSFYGDCYSNDGRNACSAKPGAVTRFGSYMYFPGQEGWWGNHAQWDKYPWSQSLGDGGTCQTTPNNTYCGIGDGGVLENNKWYRVEEFIKMNTPGQADGILQGWIDGVLSYEKTNMIFRLPGHDNLHVRTMWLNVHKGGDMPNGNPYDMNIWLDQMVLATDAQVGEFMPEGTSLPPDTQSPTAPTNLLAIPVSSFQINLSWTASTDPAIAGQATSGVIGYKIYRCQGAGCTPTQLVNSQLANLLTYSDTGLTASTAYTYAVSAYDAAGNNSAKSSSISATTQSLTTQCSDSLDNDSDGKIDFGGSNPDPDCSSLTDTTENDTTPPAISSVISTTLASTTARIDWTTNEPSTSLVEYGFTTQYGASQPEAGQPLAETLSTSHSILLSNLSPDNTTYNYRVRSKDSSNNEAISINYSFITPGLTDTVPPASTTNLKANNITQTSVDLVTWTAAGDDNNQGTAFSFDIRYATGELSENTWNDASVIRATGEPTPKPAGSVMNYTLVGLFPNTTYKVALKTLDEVSNQSLISNVITFTTVKADTTPAPTPSPSPAPAPAPAPAPTPTPAAPSSGGGGGGGSSIISDTTPAPKITELKAQGADKQVRLTWKNPENSDWVRTILVRKAGGFATSTKDGSVVFEGTEPEFTDINLKNNENYYYSLFTIDRTPNYSQPANIMVKTIALKVSLEEIKPAPITAREQEVLGLASEAAEIIKSDLKSFLSKFNFKRDQAKEDISLRQYVKELIKGLTDLMADRQIALNHFIAYGTATTLKLGAGERAGVVNSYKSAFNQLPTTAEEWTDALKIANGRWPTEISTSTEAKAVQEFKKVYKRAPNLKQANDNAAVTVMAYGLRPSNRNLNSEKAALKSFRAIYGYVPKSAIDWDIVRAVAYSGAKR